MSYSSSNRDDVDLEYDPTPYCGGYDLALTFGRPLPPSKETCYPISSYEEEQNNNQRPHYPSSQSNVNKKETRSSDRGEKTTKAQNKDSERLKTKPISSTSAQQNNNQMHQYPSRSNMNKNETKKTSNRNGRTTEAQNKDLERLKSNPRSRIARIFSIGKPKPPDSSVNGSQPKINADQGGNWPSSRYQEEQKQQGEYDSGRSKAADSSAYGNQGADLPPTRCEEQQGYGNDGRSGRPTADKSSYQPAGSSGYGIQPKPYAYQGANLPPACREEQQGYGNDGSSGRRITEKSSYQPAESSGYGIQPKPYAYQGANLPPPPSEEQGYGNDGRSSIPTFEKSSYQPADSSGYGIQPKPYTNQGGNLPPPHHEERQSYGNDYKRNQEDGFGSNDGRIERSTYEKSSYEPVDSSGYGFQPKPYANQDANLPPTRREEQYGYGGEYKRGQEDGFGSYDGRSGRPIFGKSNYEHADSSGYGYQPKPYIDQGKKLPSPIREEQQGGYNYSSEYERNQDDVFGSHDGRSGGPSGKPQRLRFP